MVELDIVAEAVDTGIDATDSDDNGKTVVSHRLFTIDGQVATVSTKGLLIDKITYNDGTTRCVKKVRR